MPVGGAGCHVKTGRVNKEICSGKGHHVGQMEKANVLADAKANFSKGRVKNRGRAARRKRVRFAKADAAFYIYVEKMGLTVPRDLGAIGSIDKT